MLLALIASATLQAQAQELFANQSANPSAAQFRNVRTVGDVVCGEVNKPNTQGGFNGFQRFAYRSKTDWAIEWGADYRLAMAGKLVDTRFLSESADRELNWDVSRASQLLGEANTARTYGDQLLASCS